MKPETKMYMSKFEETTGVKPKSARIETGSMRGFVRFVVSGTPAVRTFCEHRHDEGQNNNFNGVIITFIDGFHLNKKWSDKNTADFDVKISNLMG